MGCCAVAGSASDAYFDAIPGIRVVSILFRLCVSPPRLTSSRPKPTNR